MNKNFNDKLKKHKKSWHEVISYHYEKCEYIGNTSKNLRHHTDSKHEGINPCDQCEFSSGTLINLKKHKERKHKGRLYSCDQCEYVTTSSSTLKKHKDIEYDGIRYPFGQYEYGATTSTNLKMHTANKHHPDACLPCAGTLVTNVNMWQVHPIT